MSVLLLFVVTFACLVLPGLSLAANLYRMRACLAIIVIAVTGALCGYISFWIFFASKPLGKAWTFAVFAAALAGLIRAWRISRLAPVVYTVSLPFCFAALTGVLYLSLFYMHGFGPHDDGSLANSRFFPHGLPGDNLIPLLFAGRIYGHEPLRPFCCGDWLSSDRPPLQAGVVLFLRPLRPWGSLGLHYQLIGTALQSLWAVGCWVLFDTFGIPTAIAWRALVILSLSPFFFFNSVYVWPKMLASAFILFALSLLFDGNSRIEWAAACVGLAMLAHPGSVFSLPVFALAVLSRRERPRWSSIARAGLVLLFLMAPWFAYQEFIDPPGNRLTKMHLAAVFDIDERSTWTAIRDAYSSRPALEILHNKWTNLTNLVGSQPLSWNRQAQIRYVWSTIGLLNLGWLIYLFSLLSGWRWTDRPRVGFLFVGALVNLLVWSMLLFGPAATDVAHSSFADLILIAMASAAVLAALPRITGVLFVALEACSLFSVWDSSPLSAGWQLPFVLVAGLAILTLAWLFMKPESVATLQKAPGQHPAPL